MEEKVIGILKNISELLVATLVEETDTHITVKAPAFLGISGKNTQINVNFIPVEMLSFEPAVNIRNFLANPITDLTYTFEKNSLLLYNLELAQNVVDNYKTMNSKIPTSKSVKPPEENIVKLF